MFENRRHKCKDGDIIGPDSNFQIKSTSFILLWLRRSTGGPHSLMPDVFDKLMCEVVYEGCTCKNSHSVRGNGRCTWGVCSSWRWNPIMWFLSCNSYGLGKSSWEVWTARFIQVYGFVVTRSLIFGNFLIHADVQEGGKAINWVIANVALAHKNYNSDEEWWNLSSFMHLYFLR